ncbi:MAG: signal recognition particle-docking protein FtsY [Planctomycetia bacterium]|nr:signal recognition particle-docking protein FtsY [Planctomycetia bacterium]
MGFFSKIKQAIGAGLEKTKRALATDVRDLFKKEGRDGRLVDDVFIDQLLEILIKTDMGVSAAKEITSEVKNRFRGRVVFMQDVLETVRAKLRELLKQEEVPVKMAAAGPTVIMVVGVNGSGKTTSIAKLAHRFQAEGKKVVLGAGDTFRAAAVEQLTIWANRLGVEIVTAKQGSDPASVAHTAVTKALADKADICIVDTAGRLQTQKSLMQELTKIHRIVNRLIPEAPHEVLLVLDATAGQSGISQARGFTEAVKCTGLVLAKLDGTAKGGVVVPIRQQVGLPVKFVGVGEKLADLEAFDSEAFTEALFEGLVEEREGAGAGQPAK